MAEVAGSRPDRRNEGENAVKLTQDEILDAQKVLAEHAAALKPHNNTVASASANDWTQTARLTTAPALDLNAARAARHEALKKKS